MPFGLTDFSSRVPVDVHSMLQGRGISVSERMDVDNSGTIFWDERDRLWKVVLRAQESWARKRYTLAHELGHYVLHLENGRRTDLAPLHRQQNGALDAIEKEANRFAADLLMPSTNVKNLYLKGYGVDDLAAMFQVSKPAMYWRLHNLGLQRIS